MPSSDPHCLAEEQFTPEAFKEAALRAYDVLEDVQQGHLPDQRAVFEAHDRILMLEGCALIAVRDLLASRLENASLKNDAALAGALELLHERAGEAVRMFLAENIWACADRPVPDHAG